MPDFDQLLPKRFLSPAIQQGRHLACGHPEPRVTSGAPFAMLGNSFPIAVVPRPAGVMRRDVNFNHPKFSSWRGIELE